MVSLRKIKQNFRYIQIFSTILYILFNKKHYLCIQN